MREFWIKGETCHEFEVVNAIHVIEKSVADKLADALDAAAATLNDLHAFPEAFKCDDALKEYRGDDE